MTCAERVPSSERNQWHFDVKSQWMWFSRLRYRSSCRSFVRLMTRQQVSVTSFVTSRYKAVVLSLARRVMKLVAICFNNLLALSFVGGIRQRGTNCLLVVFSDVVF